MITTLSLHPAVVRWLAADGRRLAIPQTRSNDPSMWAEEIQGAARTTGGVNTANVALLLPQPKLLEILKTPHGALVLTPPVTHVVDLACAFLPGQGHPLAVLFAKGVFDPVTRTWCRDLSSRYEDVVRVTRCLSADRHGPQTIEDCACWNALTQHWNEPRTRTVWTHTEDVAAEGDAVFTFLDAPRREREAARKLHAKRVTR